MQGSSGSTVTCQWQTWLWRKCKEVATHTVTIDYADRRQDVWHICREHEKEVKKRVQRSLPPPPPQSGGLMPRGSLKAKKMGPGSRKELSRVTTGSSRSTRDGSWTEIERVTDVENDIYREVLEYHDGTVLKSEARLRDHS